MIAIITVGVALAAVLLPGQPFFFNSWIAIRQADGWLEQHRQLLVREPRVDSSGRYRS